MVDEKGKDPLQGVTLERIVTELHAQYGWEILAEKVHIRCFEENPSIMSSLKFLRRTPWAKIKVERLYLQMIKKYGAKIFRNKGASCKMTSDFICDKKQSNILI